ncbi:MAG: capsular biosynthesis protein [Pseudomonadota bacterium]|nr:capsular biosynthesis protein [Pseudomonadota bacterium]
MSVFLFIGAPFGPFFARLAQEIEAAGGVAYRTVCEGGEFLETPSHCRVLYRHRDGDWKRFMRGVMRRNKVDAVITFNDTLPRNRGALEVAEEFGLHSFVLENGYLRPHWVTLERDGVNGFSRLPRDPDVYLETRQGAAEPPDTQNFPAGLRPHVIHTINHFLAAIAFKPFLGFDAKYYGDSVYRQGFGYMREYLWRMTHDEAPVLARALELADAGRKVFLALLQKPGDAQLVVHSRHGGNAAFVDELISSFAADAPEDAVLVVKQHPLDYGVERTPARVAALIDRHNLADRVFFLRKTSIDKIMARAHAVVTINSTAGLAAIIEQKPVLCVGRAFYNIPGLTSAGPLSRFWRDAAPPSPALVQGFIAFLKNTSQFNGGFHTPEGREILAPLLAQRLVEGARMAPKQAGEAYKRVSYAERHRLAPSRLGAAAAR